MTMSGRDRWTAAVICSTIAIVMISPVDSHNGRRPAALFAFAAGLVTVLVLAACSSPTPTPCPDEAYPAVELAVVDEANEALIGASMRYRVDEGPWQSWPENLGRSTILRGGPGLYEIEISKAGYGSAAATVEVPVESETSCRPMVQTTTMQLARTACPEPPAALTLTIDPPQNGLEARVRMVGAGRQQLTCQDPEGEACRSFSFEVAEAGSYELEVEGLPGLGAMRVVSDVINYEAVPVDLRLSHRGVSEATGAGGSETVAFSFAVGLDEANCPLADFRDMETTYSDGGLLNEAGEPIGWPPLAVRYLGSLTMTDLGAEACQAEPVLTALPFGVDLPAGTNPDEVEMLVDYGEGWQAAECGLEGGRFVCMALTPNPLVGRPFVARVTADDQSATGFSVPFSGLCLIFQ